jgi:RsiW-degrading membrane proteinase PrsW (M82 family)
MTVPEPKPEPTDPAEILLQDDPTPSRRPAAPQHDPYSDEPFSTVQEPAEAPPPPVIPRPAKKTKQIDLASLPPLTADEPPPWRRHLHWLLVLALIPLVVSLLIGSKGAEERFQDGFEKLGEQMADSPAERERYLSQLKNAKTVEDLLALFPGKKLPGAFLSRSSLAHLLMAAAATVLYMTFFMFLASDGSANAVHVLFVGIFTATIGVGLLLLLQTIASAMEGRVIGGHVVGLIISAVLNFIAFSYRAALNPEYGFGLSFLGFTAGVGLCEEFFKVVPVFWHRSTENGRTWRGMFIWGLASGAGFGISEGIMYSGSQYNGIFGPDVYVIRFISCVALHAIWSGSAAILLYVRRDMFENLEHWYDWTFPTIFVIAVPAILHGLYDTCLKKDMNGFALLTAFASFGYLAFLFSRLQTVDDVAANKAMLKEYKRRRAAMG